MTEVTALIGTLTTLIGTVFVLGASVLGGNTAMSQVQSIRKRR